MDVNIDSDLKFYSSLSRVFSDPNAIQRTKKEETRKGYDTTGIGYQFEVNRFNEICGFQWGYDYTILKEVQGKYNSGTAFYEITVECGIWVLDRANVRKCVGGHQSTVYFDALKGAITNAFKKTAAFWGVGREAYEGTLDDDAILPDSPENISAPDPMKLVKQVFPDAMPVTPTTTNPQPVEKSTPKKEGEKISPRQLGKLNGLLSEMNLKTIDVQLKKLKEVLPNAQGLDVSSLSDLPRDVATTAIGLLIGSKG